MKDLLTLYQPPQNLRSSSGPLTLDPPKALLETYGDRLFKVIAAELWYKPPQDIQFAESVSLFKSMLKIDLLRKVLEQV